MNIVVPAGRFLRDNSPMPPIEDRARASCRASFAPTLILVPPARFALLVALRQGEPSTLPLAGSRFPFTSSRSSRRSVPVRFNVPGQIEGSKQVEVRARVQGILQKRLYNEGDAVAPASRCFRSTARRSRWRSPRRKVRSRRTAPRRPGQARRGAVKALVSDKAVAQKEYDDALSARCNSRRRRSSRARQRSAKPNSNLRTPWSRRRSQAFPVAPSFRGQPRHHRCRGQPVDDDQSGQPDLGALQPVRIRSCQGARGRSLGRDAGSKCSCRCPTDRFPARVGSISPRRRSTRVSARSNCAPNSTIREQQLLPGQFVRVRITAGQRDNVFLVPQAAGDADGEGLLVFVVDDEGNAAAQTVQTANGWAPTGRSCRDSRPAIASSSTTC